MGARDMSKQDQSFNVDGFYNLLTALGVEGQDKRLNAVASEPTVLSQQELNRLYRGDDIVARICNLPANEMVKKWFQIKATEDGDREKIDAMMQVLKDLGVKAAVREGLVWSRLHGGAVVLIGADDGRPQEAPLNEEGIRSVDYLTVLDRWDLEIVSVYNDPSKSNYRLPELYRVRTTTQPASGGAGLLGRLKDTFLPPVTDPVVHESRLIRFDGVLTPPIIKLANQGWCDSAITRVYEVVRDFQTSYAGVGLMMQDIGQAVFRIKGLADDLKHDKEGLILRRLQLMNLARSVARAVPLDADGEELVYPQQRLMGVKDVLEKFDIRLSMALGWPATVLLGQSPKGLNATGESDLTNWYDFIQGEQERNLDPQLTKLCRIVFKMLRNTPKIWAVSFNPLWQASAEEVAKERKTYAEVDAMNIDRGVYTAEEASESRYGGEEFGTEINLDKELRDTDNIPSADPKDVPELREPEEGEAQGAETDVQQKALNGAQVAALQSLLVAMNAKEITHKQAIASIALAFQLSTEEAATIVGPPPEPEPPPTPVPPGFPPQSGSGMGQPGGAPRAGNPRTEEERLISHFGGEKARAMLAELGEEAYRQLPPRPRSTGVSDD